MDTDSNWGKLFTLRGQSTNKTHHCHYWEPEGPSECRHFLLWWYFLHLSQATGLQIPYRDNDDVKTLVRRAAILLRIPLASVKDVWFKVLEDRDNVDITQLTQPFTDYVTGQWAEGDRSLCLWNNYGTEGPRTTNSIEGWHTKLKTMTQHAHPNIYNVIQLFKNIQNSIEIAKIQRTVGGTIRPRAKKYLNIDRQLATLKDRYQTGVITWLLMQT